MAHTIDPNLRLVCKAPAFAYEVYYGDTYLRSFADYSDANDYMHSNCWRDDFRHQKPQHDAREYYRHRHTSVHGDLYRVTRQWQPSAVAEDVWQVHRRDHIQGMPQYADNWTLILTTEDPTKIDPAIKADLLTMRINPVNDPEAQPAGYGAW